MTELSLALLRQCVEQINQRSGYVVVIGLPELVPSLYDLRTEAQPARMASRMVWDDPCTKTQRST